MDAIFVNNVKRLLLERKISNAQFAKMLDITESTFDRIIEQNHPVRLSEAYDISKALEVSLDELCNVDRE